MASQISKERVGAQFLENNTRLLNPSQPLIAHCRGITPWAPPFAHQSCLLRTRGVTPWAPPFARQGCLLRTRGAHGVTPLQSRPTLRRRFQSSQCNSKKPSNIFSV